MFTIRNSSHMNPADCKLGSTGPRSRSTCAWLIRRGGITCGKRHENQTKLDVLPFPTSIKQLIFLPVTVSAVLGAVAYTVHIIRLVMQLSGSMAAGRGGRFWHLCHSGTVEPRFHFK